MASSKSIFLLITFLLAALEVARSTVVCETKEDCNGKVYCPAVEGEELTCDDGKCRCVGGGNSKVREVPPIVLPPFGKAPPIKCDTDKDCRDNLSIRCLDTKTTCQNGSCRCGGKSTPTPILN